MATKYMNVAINASDLQEYWATDLPDPTMTDSGAPTSDPSYTDAHVAFVYDDGLGGGGVVYDSTRLAVAQTGHGLSVGDALRVLAGNYVAADTASEVNAEFVGFVEVVADVNNFVLLFPGGVSTILSTFFTPTSGLVYFLGVSGGIANPKPAGILNRPVLFALPHGVVHVLDYRTVVDAKERIMAVQPAPEDQGGITEATAGFTEQILNAPDDHGFTVGQFVRWDGTSAWVLANADTAAHAGDEYRTGFVDPDNIDTDAFYLRTGGKFTSATHGLGAVGTELYLTTTNGTVDDTAPSTAGQVVLKVGYVVDVNTIMVDIDNAYVIE